MATPRNWGKNNCTKCISTYGIWGHKPSDGKICSKYVAQCISIIIVIIIILYQRCADKTRKSEAR